MSVFRARGDWGKSHGARPGKTFSERTCYACPPEASLRGGAICPCRGLRSTLVEHIRRDLEMH
jgi:hypothetical protein